MGVPQIIVLILYGLTLGIEMTKNGKPREGEYSFWSSLIGCGVTMGLLIWGGFF